MNISIFGLGYVGCVGLGCLSKIGHKVIGVDIDENKVRLINDKKSTIVENGIDELIALGIEKDLITATNNVHDAISNTDIAIVCVGTPNNSSGGLDMNGIFNVAKEIGKSLKNKKSFFTIMIRSTVMPGTCNEVIKIIQEASGKINEVDFGVILNPEFLREGVAMNDFFNPPYTVVGGSSNKAIEQAKKIFSFTDAEFFEVDIKVAELIKFLNNSFHALKVSFANEIGRICKKLDIDSRALMNLFVSDNILNISPKYFMPGFSYGGSCLPKDLHALNSIANELYSNVPVLKSIKTSNDEHNDFIFKYITTFKMKNIGIYGLSFKQGTDDLRFSPSLELCEKLIGKGYAIKIFDENVSLSNIMGKNKDFLLNHLPHISSLLHDDMDSFILNLDLIVFAHNDKNISSIDEKVDEEVLFLDIVGIDFLKKRKNYYRVI